MPQEKESTNSTTDRRAFLKSVGGVGLALASLGGMALADEKKETKDQCGMSPNEDLMQEHALLNRVQLMYDEAVRRLKARADLDPEVLKGAAGIIRHFVEEYHEKLEETYVFPKFEKAGKLVELVSVLRTQHRAGRALTDTVLALSNRAAFHDDKRRAKLVETLSAFTRMYRPHETREGSVLFPALRDLMSPQEFGEMGEMFERKEHEILGAEGFEGQVKVAEGLEKKLGLYDLAQYTPR